MKNIRFVILALAALAVLAGWLWWRHANQNHLPAALYLSWDEEGHIQLYRTEINGKKPAQLTQETADILNFAPSPNGKQIAYATAREDGGSDLWLADNNGRRRRRLIACPDAVCDQIVWHPDSRRLLYERRSLDTPNLPHLWWLGTDSRETIPLEEVLDGPSQAARFSADGSWVSYVVSPDQGLEFYHFTDGRHFLLPAEMGTPAVWHPTEPTFLYRRQQVIVAHSDSGSDHQGHSHNFSLAVYLFLGNVDGRAGEPISGEDVVDDGTPAWSPNGEWIVTGRKSPRVDTGRQLWLMRPDGSEAHALTNDQTIHHGVPSWSPDGRYILYQRFNVLTPNQPPGVWMFNMVTGETTEIASRGFSPVWEP
ncbi:MAG: TolB family protein [Anaerolineae bacterium]